MWYWWFGYFQGKNSIGIFIFAKNSAASDLSDLNEMLKLITPRLNILGLSIAVCRKISILGEDFFKLCLKRSDCPLDFFNGAPKDLLFSSLDLLQHWSIQENQILRNKRKIL